MARKGSSDRRSDSSRAEDEECPDPEEPLLQEDGSEDGNGDLERRVAAAIADFVDRRASGDGLDLQAFLAEYSELSPMLKEALGAVEEITPSIKDKPAPEQFGDYRIVREIGRGGMGIVYEACQISLDRRVALKVLPASFLAEPKTVARFQREAKVAARLHHENIVSIYGMGLDSGVPYFAMEFVEGQTLRDPQLRRTWSQRGTQDASEGTDTEPSSSAWTETSSVYPTTGASPAEVPVEIKDEGTDIRPPEIDRSELKRIGEAFAGVADGLYHAHSMGVIHRDLKPSNLILDRKGRLRILDFGLARAEGQENLTESGECLGTPRYMSPEQAQFQHDSLGPGTDIYSLGVTLFEVLAGRPPFQGKNNQHSLSLIIHREPPPLRKLNPKIPRDLETIVLKCLRKAPRDRYGTAEALAQDLRRWIRGVPIEARPYSPGEKIVRHALRNKVRIAVAVSILFLLGCLGLLHRSHQSEVLARKEQDYETKVRGAVMQMQQGLLTRKVRAREMVKGDYLEWFFLPKNFVEVGREDFLWLQGQTRAKSPVEETVVQLREAEEMFPEKPDAYYHRARAFMILGRDQEALRELTEAPESVARFVPAMLLRAILFERGGELDRAQAEMERAEKSAPGEWARAWLLAERATVKEDWSEAAQAYRQLMETQVTGKELFVGSSIETYLGGGVACLEMNDFQKATEAFAMAQGGWPGFAEPVLLLGKTYLLKGEKEWAEKKFQELYSRAARQDDAALAVAEVYGSLEENEKALDWATRIEDERVRDRSRAVFLVKMGRWAEAREALKGALNVDPEDVLANSWLGLTLMEGFNKIPEAISLLRKGVRLDPKSPIAHVWLGDALARDGKLLQEALAEYSKATALDPKNPWAHISSAVTLSRNGSLKESFGEFAQAIAAYPGLASIYNNFNDLIQRDFDPRADDRRRFVAALEREVKAGNDPLLPEMLRALALVLLKTPEPDDLPRAAQYAALAVEKTERLNPRMLATLAKAEFASGQREQAVLSLEEALRLTQATKAMESELGKYRGAILPNLVSYASVDAALVDVDTEAFILEGDLWRYFCGREEPPREWSAPGFDDAAWELGESGFGYGDDDDNTVLKDMQGSYSTVYIRHEFNLPDPVHYGRILVSIKSDDGFVAYVNGRELRRFNAANTQKPIPFDGLAVKEATEPLTPTEFRVPANVLVAGRNVLAIQGLNATLRSSDFSLIPVVLGERPPNVGRDRNLLESFRAFAEGGKDEAARLRLEYLEGRVLQRSGKQEGAASLFRQLAREDPHRPEPILRLAECLKAQGRLEEAETSLHAALGAFPNEMGLWNFWAALCLADLKRSPMQVLATFPLELEEDLPWSGSSSPSSYGADVRWLLTRLRKGDAVRINCGGGDYRDRKGQLWGRDRFFHSGNRFGEPLWGILIGKEYRSFSGDIEGTDDYSIYQTERWFPVDHLTPAGYQIPLPNGSYQITLHFVEVYYRQGGKRWFDVLVEDLPVPALKGYDPCEAGFKVADHRSFPATVSDGKLDIELVRQLDSPKISGIEIRPVR